MFAYIQGQVASKEPAYVILDVHGVGYELRISLSTYESLNQKEEIRLFTHLHVKEDAQLLYGFYTQEEKTLFLDLISISGIGPNIALTMLSSLSVAELQTAIAEGQVKAIEKIKGIGAKTAQRLIIELQDKMKKVVDTSPALAQSETTNNSGTISNTIRQEALSALVTLGIPKPSAEKSVESAISIAQKNGELNTLTLEKLIKLALKTA